MIATMIVSVGILIFAAGSSLKWRCVHDSPLMIYAGWLIGNGMVPYRDLFDMNMPGTYFAMWSVGSLFGWEDFVFRCFDVVCLAVISISTFFAMRRLGRFSAWGSMLLFPLWYIGTGPLMGLQREMMALVPFSVLLAVAFGGGRCRVWKMVLAGFLAGVAASIKPQFLLLCFPVFIALLYGTPLSTMVKRSLAFIGGMLSVFFIIAVYLWRNGALMPFWDMATHYWPLYGHLTKWHSPISGGARLGYLIKMSLVGLCSTYYLPPALVGLFLLHNRGHKNIVLFAGGLLLSATVYPAVSGQFWRYHWLPLFYVAASMTAFCAQACVENNMRWTKPLLGFTVLIFISSFWLQSTENILRARVGYPAYSRGSTVFADEIAGFLRENVEPGDTVQPLDWTSGAVYGLLLAKVPLATRYMYDFHFYHHINSPYIQKLRREFIEELEADPPRFVVQVLEDRSWPNGENTSREFFELTAFLNEHYGVAIKENSYQILRRR